MKTAIICECVQGDWESPRPISEIELDLRSKNHEVVRIPDLCGKAAFDPAALGALFESAEIAVVAACAPRAVKWLCAAAGVPAAKLANVEFINYVAARGQDATRSEDAPSGKDERTACALKNPEGKSSERPWFPVLDYDRCTNCGACMDFCLFGVFNRLPDGKVVVENPGNCKDNCPACARICPVEAVMFPKHVNAAINGGSAEKSSNRSKPLFAMSGEELYEALKNRRGTAKRTDIFKNDL